MPHTPADEKAAYSRAIEWDDETLGEVIATFPNAYRTIDSAIWAAVVELSRDTYETAPEAARRLSAYVDAYQQETGRPPTLTALTELPAHA